jgi:hypothetical protein
MSEYIQRLTRDRAVELLEELIAEFGADYVYQPPDGTHCVYVHDDQPSCGVGHVLARAGVPVDVLASVDGTNFASVTEAVVFEDYVEPDALDLLGVFQLAQDDHAPWGESLRRAVGGGTGG